MVKCWGSREPRGAVHYQGSVVQTTQSLAEAAAVTVPRPRRP